MGPGIVILFWLVVAGIYGFIFLVLAGLCILGWKKRWIWLKWLTGIPAACMALLAISLTLLLTCGILRSMNPRSIFKDTFGESASAEVKDIHSKMWWFADTGSVYLTFKTSETEFRRLVPSGLTERTAAEMERETPGESGSSAPSWWTYRYQSGWIYFLRNDDNFGQDKPAKKGFFNETEYFAYDPNTKTAYYRFLGID
jgi:hypothetical protein